MGKANEKAYEIEMKLQLLDGDALNKVAEFLAESENASYEGEIKMRAIYFDTKDRLLGREKIAYRIRREGESLMATLKGRGSAEGGLHKRIECNVKITSEAPNLAVFKNTEGEALLEKIGAAELLELVRTDFSRSLYIWKENDLTAEIALDKGTVSGGGKSAPILEMELELKEGSEEKLKAAADFFCARFAMEKNDTSKFLRGLHLINEKFTE
jgi:triphosphatase